MEPRRGAPGGGEGEGRRVCVFVFRRQETEMCLSLREKSLGKREKLENQGEERNKEKIRSPPPKKGTLFASSAREYDSFRKTGDPFPKQRWGEGKARLGWPGCPFFEH